MSSKVVKLSFNGDLRRVRLDDAAARSHAALLEVVYATFPQLNALPTPPAVQYEDDEGELITVGSDVELQEAFRLAAECGKPSVRFVIANHSSTFPVSGSVPLSEDSSKRVKTEVSEPVQVLTPPSSTTTPVSAPASQPSHPVGTGVPVEQLEVLMAVLCDEVHTNPVAFMATAMSLINDPAVLSLATRVFPLFPDMSRVLQTVSTDPALRKVLSAPAIAPHLETAGINLDDCVPATASPSTPASGAAPVNIHSLFPGLLQHFAGLNLGVPSMPQSAPSTSAVPEAASLGLAVHNCVSCDGCGMGPIVGDRFKCSVCPDFDLCGVCNARKAHAHPMTHIATPAAFQPSPAGTTLDGKPVHAHITCDGCETTPIVGARFKCTVCPDFDLCEACEATNVHSQHALLKIRDASQTPAKLIAVLREDQHVESAVHSQVDGASVFNLQRGNWHGLGRHGGRGCGRGRKHERTWNHRGGRHQHFDRSPSVEDPDVAAAIAESLRMSTEASVDTMSAAPETAMAAPVSAPAPSVPVVLVKQDGEEYVARFVTHLTLTDASPTQGGAHVIKTWRMKNDGVRAWPEGTRLVHVGAETLGCPEGGVVVPAVGPGTTVDISVPLVAPDVPGRHVGYFRLVTPAGVRFGHRIWADLFVENSNVPAVLKTMSTPLIAVPAPTPSAPAMPFLPIPVTPSLPSVPVTVPVVVEPKPEPVPVPEPAQPEWMTRYRDQLTAMAEMGFFDVDSNVAALEASEGNVGNAVLALLNAASSS